MKEVKYADHLPKETHLATLEFIQESIYHEGDERSRTHPGHGYPAYSETKEYVRYHAFENKEELENWILIAIRQKANFRIVNVEPLNYKIETKVIL